MARAEYSTVVRANRCNELCTRFLTGCCALCDALAERDRFEWPFWWLVGVLSAWFWDAWQYVTGPTGYRMAIPVLITLVGAYVGLYAIAKARHDRLLNRATFERNTFITMVSSGNRGAFVAAMKDFGPIQNFRVTLEPALWPPFSVWIEETG